MKRALNLSVFASSLLISLTAFQAQASTFVCLGVDEGGGFARVNATPPADGPVTAFGHAGGYELRLTDIDGYVGLTLKKDSEIISVTSKGSEGILFSNSAVNVNCAKTK